MASDSIGVVHPGEMGAAVAAQLATRGLDVCFASEGRSPATLERARASGLKDLGSLDSLLSHCDVVLSICPPGAALDVAKLARRFSGLFVDANAVSTATALEIARVVEDDGATYVDGGIVGPPPTDQRGCRIYLSGAAARDVAALFAGTRVTARLLGEDKTAASAMKMAYSAWSKGSSALALAARAYARAAGVEDALVGEWQESASAALALTEASPTSVWPKAWRWVAEMEEIATSLGKAGLPEGFHRAAAEIYRRCEQARRLDGDPGVALLLAGLIENGRVEDGSPEETSS